MKEQEIGVGLEIKDRDRVERFLTKFIPHVKSGKLAICGGLATRFYLAQHGVLIRQGNLNDIDLLIEKPDDILPSVTDDFMIYHYHPPGVDDPVETSYFFYAFVDPETKLKADVFPYRWSSPGRFIQAGFHGDSVRIVGIEDQMIQCLYDVSRISKEIKVDPKQLEDVHTFMKIADTNLAEKIWRKNNHPSYPKTFREALERADNLRKEKHEWWQKHPYRRPKPYVCDRCQERSDYPITDMKLIYEVLGYVE